MSVFSDRLFVALKSNNIKPVDLVSLSKPYWDKYGSKLTESDLSLYFNHNHTPSKKKLSIICDTLGVDEQWLLGYGDDSTNDEEKLLLNAWRLAPDSVRVNVAFLLRDYGMTYDSKKEVRAIS